MLLSRAFVGFVQSKEAEGCSLRTVDGYRRELQKWLAYLGDQAVASIAAEHVRAYLSYLRTSYTPRRLTGKNDQPLSPKTIRNVWAVLSAFFTWAAVEFKIPDPMDEVPAPKHQKTEIHPLTREQVEAVLKACENTREARTNQRRTFKHTRATANRDRALIKVLLDTGLRASELCQLRIGDYDPATGDIRVRFGKGGKSRMAYLEKSARRDVWRYLATRDDVDEPDAPLFAGHFNRPMTKDGLRILLTRLGQKAGVPRCHPHRFRHTFALEFLRSGGDVFTLQKLMGHSTLDMVRHYLNLAQVDVRNAHRRASPVDNWRL
jgi:integrase/recombinase XerD